MPDPFEDDLEEEALAVPEAPAAVIVVAPVEEAAPPPVTPKVV